MFLKPIDKLLIAIIFIAFLGGSALAWFFFGDIVILPMLAVMLLLITAFIIEAFRRIESQLSDQEKKNVANYRQTEALFNLHSTLKIRKPLPTMKNFTIFPDFASTLVDLIKERRPKVVLELGSGVSTIISGYSLEQLGGGMVISLEHEQKYARLTRRHLRAHGLEKYTKVIHAPLKEVRVGDRTWHWYDKAKLKGIKNIDMLIVDGPPGLMQRLSRYPALPMLHDKLSHGAIVVLEDAKRRGEKQIVKMWMNEYKGFEYELIDTHKGAAILRKTS